MRCRTFDGPRSARARCWGPSILVGVVLALLAGCSGGGGGSGAAGATGPSMVVTPSVGFTAVGLAGGPFAPAGQIHTVSNAGMQAFTWSVAVTEPWLRVSTAGGVLTPGHDTLVTVSIDQAAAALEPPGLHPADVQFVNLTDGAGNTEVEVILDVRGVTELTVTPFSRFVSSGPVGGPFAPISKNYQLRNTGTLPLDWSATANDPAIRLGLCASAYTARIPKT